MNIFKNIFSIIGNSLDTILNWLLSDKSSGVMTLITVITVYWLYLIQKNAQKENAAKTIYLEMLDIERKIDNISSQDIDNPNTILDKIVITSNHWDSYLHLFANNLTLREIEIVNDFYFRAKIAQKLLDKIQFTFEIAMDEKSKSIQQQLIKESVKSEGDKNIHNVNKAKWLKVYEEETYWFLPHTYKIRLKDLIKLIPKVTQTGIGIKLSKIAKI